MAFFHFLALVGFFFFFFFNVGVQKWTVSLYVLSVEEAKSNASDTVPKQDPPPPPQTHSSKRKLSHVDLTNSSYFKIRAAVQQLRPKVFQALQTPDFRGCKAAHELRSQSKLMMDLYNQMTTAAGLGKNVGGRQLPDRHRDGGIHQPSHISAETFTSRMKFDDGLKIRGSYVVGGSVCGWKFITWAGSGPNYYGVTKESHRDTLKKPAAGGSHCN